MNLKTTFFILTGLFFLAELFAQSASNNTGAYASVYTQRLEDALAIYFTPDQFDIATDGSKDVSDALQDAINKVQETIRQGILFIPEGTYRISKTIYVWRGIRLIGYGKKRPVFLLGENTPNYQEGRGKYMFHFCHDRTKEGEPVEDAWASTFYSGIRNINIRIDPGNPAAIAIRFHIAQHSFLSHMDFHLNDGNTGVEDMGNEIEYCRFFGGDYGINTGATSPGWQALVIDSYFEKQRLAAIRTQDAGMTVIRNQIKTVPTAISINEGASEKLWISDSRFENISGPAIVASNEFNPNTQINLENIVCSNVPEFVFMRENGKKISSPHKQYQVKELTHGLVYDSLDASPMIKTTYDLVPLKKLPPPVLSDVFLLPDIKTWVNIKSLGAKGDGITDDTDIMEKAIAGYSNIYFPSGHYRITRPVVLQKHTVLIGLSPVSTQIVLTDAAELYQGVGAPVPLLETPEGGKNIVTGIGLAVTGNNPRAVAAKWMAGKESMMNDVRFYEDIRKYVKSENIIPAYNSTPPADERQYRKLDTRYWSLWITNGGGGTFKDIWLPAGYACAGMNISKTSTEGRLYLMSVEHHVRHEVIIDQVSNWRFYALQFEEEHPVGLNCLPLYIRNSNNLLFANTFSYRVSRTVKPFPYMILMENSKNMIFKGIHNWSWTKHAFENTLYDRTSNINIRSREIALLKISEPVPLVKTNTSDSQKINKLAGGFEFIDGITTDSRGNVYFIDYGKQNIYRWDTNDQLSLISHFPIFPVSLACDKNDHLMVVTHFNHPFSIFNKGAGVHWSGNYTTYIDAVGFDPENPETTIRRLEEIPISEIFGKTVYYQSSRYRMGDPASALPAKLNTCYISQDGTTVITKTDDLGQTYSLKKAIPGQSFFVTNTQGFKTYRCKVNTDGSLSDPQLFSETGAGDVVTDSKGNIYIPADNILVYDREGTVIDEIEVPERPSNIIFGGPGNNTLFICAGTSLYSYKLF